tara:strand:+ start:12204 stop:13067 length:864 start_codon:yes stop_codon:yes gene_type:complete
VKQIRKAVKADFEDAYNVLKLFNHPKIKKEDWKRIFTDYWEKNEKYYGYVLEDNNKIVGFAGAVFSERVINDREYKFCNLTSIIVRKEYRNQSLAMLYPLLTMPGYTITVLGPAKETVPIYMKTGFKIMNTNIRIILPKFRLNYRNKPKVVFNLLEIVKLLNSEERKILDDHINFNCKHILVKSNIGNCYMVAVKYLRKNFSFIHIIYISNKFIFSKFINNVCMKLMLRYNIIGVLIDDRLTRGKNIPLSFCYKQKNNVNLYKSSTLTDSHIDLLYTEYFLLDHFSS